jgi:hypothetical protein
MEGESLQLDAGQESPAYHCAQSWTLLSRPEALPDLPFSQSRFPALPQLLRSQWAMYRRLLLVEPCAASSRTAVECQARLSPAAWPSSLQTLPAAHTQQWRLDPGRPRLPEPKAAAGTETWLRSQSTACTCFSSLCGLGQM